METLMMIISILLIAIVLLQSGKAESSAQILSGEVELLKNRKERGPEKAISNITLILGILFFVISLVANYI